MSKHRRFACLLLVLHNLFVGYWCLAYKSSLLLQEQCRGGKAPTKPREQCTIATDPVLEAVYSKYNNFIDVTGLLENHTRGESPQVHLLHLRHLSRGHMLTLP